MISAPIIAESRSGALVDSACYTIEEHNVTMKNEEVNHERNFEITQCEPSLKTKSFAVVQEDGQMFRLNAAGNDKAEELIRKIGKKSRVHVSVTGSKIGPTVNVESISIAP